jgi:hypothetical protein
VFAHSPNSVTPFLLQPDEHKVRPYKFQTYYGKSGLDPLG